jgi:hypothetical protein
LDRALWATARPNPNSNLGSAMACLVLANVRSVQAGAGGFRDFPLSPAAKENRNGSRRTLPVTLLCQLHKLFQCLVILLDSPGQDVVVPPMYR